MKDYDGNEIHSVRKNFSSDRMRSPMVFRVRKQAMNDDPFDSEGAREKNPPLEKLGLPKSLGQRQFIPEQILSPPSVTAYATELRIHPFTCISIDTNLR